MVRSRIHLRAYAGRALRQSSRRQSGLMEQGSGYTRRYRKADPVGYDWSYRGRSTGEVCLYEPAYFFHHPLEIPQLWHGGMSFHGGFIGATLAIILFARNYRISILSYLDLSAAVAPIGIFLVRLANFVNGELWGRITDVPWAVIFPSAGPAPRHPSQIYEAILEGLLLFFLLRLLVRLGALKRPGLVAGCFTLGYASARSIGEIFREPDGLVFGPITMGMAYSAPMAAIGAGLIIQALRGPSVDRLEESSQ
jgi:phosphatidylglycerol:prolipoprotein diacylglycerol transferase